MAGRIVFARSPLFIRIRHVHYTHLLSRFRTRTILLFVSKHFMANNILTDESAYRQLARNITLTVTMVFLCYFRFICQSN